VPCLSPSPNSILPPLQAATPLLGLLQWVLMGLCSAGSPCLFTSVTQPPSQLVSWPLHCLLGPRSLTHLGSLRCSSLSLHSRSLKSLEGWALHGNGGTIQEVCRELGVFMGLTAEGLLPQPQSPFSVRVEKVSRYIVVYFQVQGPVSY
jgi:hypothetical protein